SVSFSLMVSTACACALAAITSPRLVFSHSDASPDLHSFPTRRSSDLDEPEQRAGIRVPDHIGEHRHARHGVERLRDRAHSAARKDRKSTRLNSSHEWISYAVFCLKKKTS